MENTTESQPIDLRDTAASFRRLAQLAIDPELAARMVKHAEEMEKEAAEQQPKRAILPRG